ILDGIWQFFSGAGFGGLWIAFIGWFLMDAAKASYAELEIKAALRGVRVSEVMSRDCAIVSPRMSLQEFVNTYLLRAGERCFAVEDQGRFVGLITPRDVGSIPRDRWDKTTVREPAKGVARHHSQHASSGCAKTRDQQGCQPVAGGREWHSARGRLPFSAAAVAAGSFG